jgi:hypothetical protein
MIWNLINTIFCWIYIGGFIITGLELLFFLITINVFEGFDPETAIPTVIFSLLLWPLFQFMVYLRLKEIWGRK